MRRRKLIFLLIALSLSLMTLLTQPALAYYTVLGEAVNVVTSGDIQLKVIERMGDQDFPKEGVTILPGSIISKKVSVKNTGSNPLWLRIRLINSIDHVPIPANLMELDINTGDWTDKDGYYYYNKILEPGQETEELFNQVKITGDAGNEYAGKTIRLVVNAYGVQSKNNEAEQPWLVAGWPAED